MELNNENYVTEVIIFTAAISTLIAIGFYISNRNKKAKMSPEIAVDDNVAILINGFIQDIIFDYYNEYRINYLATRYNLEALEEKTYVFKTKKIGTLNGILEYNQVPLGDNYINHLIHQNYNVAVLDDDQLSFIIDVSRIEGKMKAVESIKIEIPREDYIILMSDLEEQLSYYKNKYSV